MSAHVCEYICGDVCLLMCVSVGGGGLCVSGHMRMCTLRGLSSLMQTGMLDRLRVLHLLGCFYDNADEAWKNSMLNPHKCE